MKKTFTFLLLLFAASVAKTQIICNPSGNLVLFTNYDGGVLNIDVDVNIPNLKIGVVSYEAVSINLSGAYVNNVTAVHYAGYNGTNNNCGSGVTVTSISGAPVGASTSIVFAPASPLANPYGYSSIICGYTCSTTSNQGGCNTIDQIEAYFANYFPGAVKRSHKVQYNCWSGTQTVSGGGTCCLSTSLPLAVSVNAVPPSCNGGCNGSATAIASGGQAPYTYQWAGGPASATYNNLCPGVYVVTVSDALGNTATQSVTINNPLPITHTMSQTSCSSYFFNGNNLTASGTYKDTLVSALGCDSVLTLNLVINTVNTNLTQTSGTLTSAASGATYKWLNCSTNIIIPGAIAQSYTPTANGDYAVIVTQGGCTDTSVCKTVVVSGIDEQTPNELFSFYPNPVDNELFIKIDASLIGHECSVTDVAGHILLRKTLQTIHSTLDMHHVAKGIYFIEIEGVKAKQKFLK